MIDISLFSRLEMFIYGSIDVSILLIDTTNTCRWAAIETAKKAPEGSVIVCMLPDTGERYLSTPLFASIDADMNEEELKIARSTPSHILEPITT